MQLIELAAQYRATATRCVRARPPCVWSWRPCRVPAAPGRDLEARIARLEQMAGETLCTASYLAHYYDRS